MANSEVKINVTCRIFFTAYISIFLAAVYTSIRNMHVDYAKPCIYEYGRKGEIKMLIYWFRFKYF